MVEKALCDAALAGGFSLLSHVAIQQVEEANIVKTLLPRIYLLDWGFPYKLEESSTDMQVRPNLSMIPFMELLELQ